MTCREFATRSTCLLLRYAAVLKKRDHAAYLSYPVDGLGIPEEKATNFTRNGSDVKTDLKAYCCLAVFYLACTPFVFAQAPAVSPGGTVVAAGLRHGFGLPR
jgi:hypothetical protein